MARLNKFSPVNLNDSYGKPDHSGSASHSSNNGSTSSGKPRSFSSSSSGGMLVLTRPRGTAQQPSSSSKPSQPRLGIPSPVNLPSLKRETSGGDPLAVSPPLAGWTKGESPPLPGWAKGESLSDQVSHLHQNMGLSKSLDTGAEGLNATPLGKSDVYAPPALRAMQCSTTLIVPTAPSVEKPSAFIRGEEFPTLQAAVARPPTPPQHPRQKDLQQKQREKQLEVKEQQLKLQRPLLSQGQMQIQGDSSQVTAAYQPSLSLRPLGRQEPLLPKSSVDSEASLNSSSLLNRQNSPRAQGSLSRSPPMGITNKTEAAHNFRPQYKSPFSVSPSSEARQSDISDTLEPSWLSSSGREFLQPTRNDNLTKLMTDELGRMTSDLGSSLYERESYLSKDSSMRQEVKTARFGRGDAYAEQEGFSREGLDSKSYGRSSSRLYDVVPRIEGFDNKRSSGWDAYNRDPKEVNNRMVGDSNNREAADLYCRDVRENHSRDIGVAYDRDVSEAYSSGTSRDTYTRDVKEVYTQNVSMTRLSSYGYLDYCGDSSRGGNAIHNNYLHWRGSTGLTSLYSPGADAYHSRRYGPQGGRDQFAATEVRPSSEFRGSRESAPYSSVENFGSRRVRSPGLGSSTYDPVKQVHEVHSEKPQSYFEEDRQSRFEDKRVDVKVTSNEAYGPGVSEQKPVLKREGSQGSPAMGTQSGQVKKVDSEVVISREKQPLLEDERRKEAARMKLLELEARIAQRAAKQGRKEDGESKDDNHSSALLLKHQAGEPMPARNKVEQESRGSLADRDVDVSPWRQEESGAKLPTRPSSASSRIDYKTPGEGHVSQEQDYRLVSESELNQDRRVVRSRSSGSWRKEIGSGPTSKLFSAPYIESGGMRRPSDGGTYKLF